MVENPLDKFDKKHRFLIGIDSDGCAFDSMEVKHKECFIPSTIRHFELQAISRFAREAAEFVNLYSKWRGINRFPALILTMDLLRDRPEVIARNVDVPRLQGLREWMDRETKLGMPALEAEVGRTSDRDLKLAHDWSRSVNESIADMVHGVPPFPFVRESLERLNQVSDLIVCSATPNEALVSEWTEHELEPFVRAICGQEVGSKQESLAHALRKGYNTCDVLMIGDAPGDLKAAQSVNASFYPILPGQEEASWQRFFEEGIERFLEGRYTGDYEQGLLAEFDAQLPAAPPWKH